MYYVKVGGAVVKEQTSQKNSKKIGAKLKILSSSAGFLLNSDLEEHLGKVFQFIPEMGKT